MDTSSESVQAPPLPPSQLRPLGYGELFDEAVDLYRRHFKLFFIVTNVLLIPDTLASRLLMPTPQGSIHPGEFGRFFLTLIGGTFAILPFSQLNHAALVLAISKSYLGKRTDVVDCYRQAIHRWPALTGQVFLVTAAIMVGMIFCLLPGIIWTLNLSFATFILLIENKGVMESLGRSKSLVTGHRRRVLLINTLLFAISAAFLFGPPVGIAYLLPHSPYQTTIDLTWRMIVYAFYTPFWSTINVLLYFDVRVRKEGFDVVHSLENSIRP